MKTRLLLLLMTLLLLGLAACREPDNNGDQKVMVTVTLSLDGGKAMATANATTDATVDSSADLVSASAVAVIDASQDVTSYFYDHLTTAFDVAMVDSNKQVTLSVPLETSIRLVEATFATSYSKSQIETDNPDALNIGISDPLTVTTGTTQQSVYIALKDGCSTLVESINPSADVADTTTMSLKTQYPVAGATEVDPGTPMFFFFDDAIQPITLTKNNFLVKSTAKGADTSSDVCGRISNLYTSKGASILVMNPFKSLAENATINISMPLNGLKDKGGNGLSEGVALHFYTGTKNAKVPNIKDFGFEYGLAEGFTCVGDCGVLSNFGTVKASEGKSAAFLSTGSQVASLTGEAQNKRVSILSIGNISEPGNFLNGEYMFISEEFDEYVGSSFDDFLLVVVSGPKGAVVAEMASVNGIGAAASTPGSYSGLSGAEQSALLQGSLDISQVGRPMTITFLISDVADASLTSVGMIDNISLTDTAKYVSGQSAKAFKSVTAYPASTVPLPDSAFPPRPKNP
ncbi:MAG: hypothetical protein A2527_06335 [Candidatus Lambdaproteobacteria bacterium RIFOXYD2_FULL_50_16]|uniref:SbsA Ig-like domain-containing protein n=1 Tax=Candidatus Lambdaproteobacteria bacterium RIFOXYD2_FULL_50_16 TaxID=1817772 RepID=A0A1F6GA28_9PROT|nr:MAG: hypothetical protein A2527_06335 [Candidatus Lambdaproteobacteria bacterium RIFOXYD2_FULL_50_16]